MNTSEEKMYGNGEEEEVEGEGGRKDGKRLRYVK